VAREPGVSGNGQFKSGPPGPPNPRFSYPGKDGWMKATLIFGYHGHGKRWGLIRFGNGITLRAGAVAVHVWRP
jgi:hypothetical protein